MANKNRNLIIAYYPSKYKAEQAAKDLKNWEKSQNAIKLGGIGIITEDEEGNLKTKKVGAYATGTGAKWGLILGLRPILSGGITLIGGAIAGLAGGAVAGALFHKKIGMDDDDKARLIQHLKDGGAALAIMADDEEVDPTKFELSSLGGEVESYTVPEETADELEAAAAEEGIEEQEEVVVAAEDENSGEAAAVVATAVVADAVIDDEDGGDAVVEEVVEPEAIVDEDVAPIAKAATTAVVAEAVTSDDDEEDQPPQATLHFKRYNGDYDGWGLHVWTGYEVNHLGQTLPPTGRDEFGIYFTVPIAEGAAGLGYIIHRGDEKDHWDDQYLNLTRMAMKSGSSRICPATWNNQSKSDDRR